MKAAIMPVFRATGTCGNEGHSFGKPHTNSVGLDSLGRAVETGLTAAVAHPLVDVGRDGVEGADLTARIACNAEAR
ncbi:MAG: hypothetical protein ACJAV2_003762 [Myxococcota bacterium]|jgi:hypothetical protein